MSETILALSSAPGRAGVAVIRLSGRGSAAALMALAGDLPPPRRASLRRLRDADGATLDRALVLWLPAPTSFTGEDMAELHVHGGRAVVQSVMTALLAQPGVALAEPGAFTRRAFENGKLDLTEVEGLGDLIDAETESQRRQAIGQAEGSLRRLYEGWRSDILRAQAQVEALLDFSDEADVAAYAFADIGGSIVALRNAIDAHLSDGRRGEILRDGYGVVIAGPPNAGKSTLLNALAGRDAAIVSDEPGTTRDLIEVRLDLGGAPVIVTDTAGLRDEGGAVEAEGVRRALVRAEQADGVIWLTDGALPYVPPPDAIARHRQLLIVRNKADLGLTDGAPAGAFSISAKDDVGLSELVDRLAKDASATPEDAPALTRARHRVELERARDALARYLADENTPLEMAAEELRLAAAHLGRITGRIDVEDVLGAIFASFCIGK